HRGQGLARRLLEAAIAEAKRMEIEMIDAAARAGSTAEDAYRKLGFVEFGRLPGGLVMDPEEIYDLVYFYLPVEDARTAGSYACLRWPNNASYQIAAIVSITTSRLNGPPRTSQK